MVVFLSKHLILFLKYNPKLSYCVQNMNQMCTPIEEQKVGFLPILLIYFVSVGNNVLLNVSDYRHNYKY